MRAEDRLTRSDINEIYVSCIEPKLEKIKEGCWLYNGSKTTDGYGRVYLPLWLGLPNGSNITAHRLSYLYHYEGKLQDIHVLHKCDVRNCCNPAHLFLGTNCDNVADRVSKGRSHRPVGTLNGRVILDEKQVIAIYTSKQSERWLAKLYGIGTSAVGRIRRKQAWVELTDLYDEMRAV